MFFSRKKKEEAIRLAKNEETTRRFASVLASITEINNMISETVVKTQAANLELLDKLKRHLKNGSQSFVSISNKLKTGVLILDHKGEVIQSNPKAREILKCNESGCVGNNIYDMITPITPQGEPFFISSTFFSDLSKNIFNTMISCDSSTHDCNTCYSKCLSKMGCTIFPNVEQLVKINSPTLKGEQFISFSILDNKPDEEEDIAYLILFRPARSKNEPTEFTRRLTDKVA